jgi:hypothetical protein
MPLDDLALPVGEHDRPLVLASGPVLREQAGPVSPQARHVDAAHGRHNVAVGAGSNAAWEFRASAMSIGYCWSQVMRRE